jgi:hypothetical protein
MSTNIANSALSIPPSVRDGRIKAIPVSPLENKLVIVVSWKVRDYTDWDHWEYTLDIDKLQWPAIIEKKMVDKVATWEILSTVDGTARIVFPKSIYSEDEVHALVLKAWHDGYNSSEALHGGRLVAKNSPDGFWEENKKK